MIIAIDPSGYYEKTDFKEEMSRRKAIYDTKELGNFNPLQGGIYVFGRVENEEDREHYREQIYQFIQYLKQEGMFDYVDLTIYISDERYLSKEFEELKIQDKLTKNYMEYKNGKKREKEDLEAFRKRKKDIYHEIGEIYTTNEKSLENIKKWRIMKIDEVLLSGVLCTSKIVTTKLIETNYFHSDNKKKDYDKLEDIEL